VHPLSQAHRPLTYLRAKLLKKEKSFLIVLSRERSVQRSLGGAEHRVRFYFYKEKNMKPSEAEDLEETPL
jgi:hypothetical protein